MLKIVSRHLAIAPVWSRSIAAAIVLVLCLVSMSLGGLQLVEVADVPLPFVAARTLDSSIAVSPVTPAAAALLAEGQSARLRDRTVRIAPPAQHSPAAQSVSPPRSELVQNGVEIPS
jgi:hypothetical protein